MCIIVHRTLPTLLELVFCGDLSAISYQLSERLKACGDATPNSLCP
ncbi:MAG: hypothetical protein F6K44_03475 [Moorea sp. SIO3E2]|nr:hypothetical protein [Moorena sp. SIO3E2]